MEKLFFVIIVCFIVGAATAEVFFETEPKEQGYELITDTAEQVIIKDTDDNLIYVSKEGKGVFVKHRYQNAEKLEVEENEANRNS